MISEILTKNRTLDHPNTIIGGSELVRTRVVHMSLFENDHDVDCDNDNSTTIKL
jgi:hypothetical protein